MRFISIKFENKELCILPSREVQLLKMKKNKNFAINLYKNPSLNLRFILVLFLVIFQNTNAQSLSVNYGNQKLVLNRKYISETNKDSIEINTLKFYISNLRFYKKNLVLFRMEKPILINLEENKLSTSIPDNLSQFDSMSFDLGIDSLTNVSGVMDGDLDPMHGMYWAWQSGYINFKLEGNSKVCKTRKNIFQYHIGGYAFPFSAMQSMGFNLNHKNNVNIVIDIKKILDSIDINSINEIMSPRKEAVEISKIIAKSFSIENY